MGDTVQSHVRLPTLMRAAIERERLRLGWSFNRWVEHACAQALPQGWEHQRPVGEHDATQSH